MVCPANDPGVDAVNTKINIDTERPESREGRITAAENHLSACVGLIMNHTYMYPPQVQLVASENGELGKANTPYTVRKSESPYVEVSLDGMIRPVEDIIATLAHEIHHIITTSRSIPLWRNLNEDGVSVSQEIFRAYDEQTADACGVLCSGVFDNTDKIRMHIEKAKEMLE